MIKRILTTILLLACLCSSAWANQEISVKLDTKDRCVQNIRIGSGLGSVIFEYVEDDGRNAQIRISVENHTQSLPHAILIFQKSHGERTLKKRKPKVAFEKSYMGKIGFREVLGCDKIQGYCHVVTGAEKDTLCVINIPFSQKRKVTIPIYVANYKPKECHKKGKNNAGYKILEQIVYDFEIEIEGWTENDPTYLATKKSVEDFLASLQDVEFCDNKKHTPVLKEQQRPYQEARDSLIRVIRNIYEENDQWITGDAPLVAYSKLSEVLQAVDLDRYNADCGKHIVTHRCGYCTLSVQQLYHRLDDTYQQLYVGRITKENAVRVARSIYACYQNNKTRRRDRSYDGKISDFYNRILKY